MRLRSWTLISCGLHLLLYVGTNLFSCLQVCNSVACVCVKNTSSDSLLRWYVTTPLMLPLYIVAANHRMMVCSSEWGVLKPIDHVHRPCWASYHTYSSLQACECFLHHNGPDGVSAQSREHCDRSFLRSAPSCRVRMRFASCTAPMTTPTMPQLLRL